jgi:SAM-dependent methyltransferase
MGRVDGETGNLFCEGNRESRTPILPSDRVKEIAAGESRHRQEFFDVLYSRDSNPWAHAVYRRTIGHFAILQLLLDNLQTNQVVDFGCGSGELTALLTDFATSVVGVDVSDQALSIARSTWPHAAARFHSEGTFHLQLSRHRPTIIVMRDVDYFNRDDIVDTTVLRVASMTKAPIRVLIGRTAHARSHNPVKSRILRNALVDTRDALGLSELAALRLSFLT